MLDNLQAEAVCDRCGQPLEFFTYTEGGQFRRQPYCRTCDATIGLATATAAELLPADARIA